MIAAPRLPTHFVCAGSTVWIFMYTYPYTHLSEWRSEGIWVTYSHASIQANTERREQDVGDAKILKGSNEEGAKGWDSGERVEQWVLNSDWNERNYSKEDFLSFCHLRNHSVTKVILSTTASVLHTSRPTANGWQKMRNVVQIQKTSGRKPSPFVNEPTESNSTEN